ncbi:hypothetical protein EU555_01905 [Methylobacterium nonmethylotrophicum]|uniref:Uncharacterized protein n=1 Tax=Methylobacterium nonmethylotrophicum TaxID=1141884 RepID=A0A4Z0P068_9HYPH|nr:hypothetical protein EU555_01905 [Methylobacterium nonmethylotrophicum]
MTQFDTKASAVGQAASILASYETRLRQVAVMLALAVGVPLVLAWFGLLGWGVLWLAKSALAL